MDEAPMGTGTPMEEEETPMEDSLSVPKRKASLLLMSLLGQPFTDTEGKVEPKTPMPGLKRTWRTTVNPHLCLSLMTL